MNTWLNLLQYMFPLLLKWMGGSKHSFRNVQMYNFRNDRPSQRGQTVDYWSPQDPRNLAGNCTTSLIAFGPRTSPEARAWRAERDCPALSHSDSYSRNQTRSRPLSTWKHCCQNCSRLLCLDPKTSEYVQTDVFATAMIWEVTVDTQRALLLNIGTKCGIIHFYSCVCVNTHITLVTVLFTYVTYIRYLYQIVRYWIYIFPSF